MNEKNVVLKYQMVIQGILQFTETKGGYQVGIGSSNTLGDSLAVIPNNDEVVIPSFVEVDGIAYPIVATDIYCFRTQSSVKKVTLPKTLKKIGTDTFWKTSITEFFIPSSVTQISYFAFSAAEKI